MVRRQRSASSTSSKPKREQGDAGRRNGPAEDDAAVRAARVPPPWRSAHVIFGLSHFVAAAVLWFVSDQPRDDSAGRFAHWVTTALVFAGVCWSIFGFFRGQRQPLASARFDELHPRWFFLETWKTMDREAIAERASVLKQSRSGYDVRPLLTLAGGAVFLTLMEYFGTSVTFMKLLHALAEGADPSSLLRAAETGPFARLFQFAWWSGWRVLGYFILPVALIWATRGHVKAQGLETKGFWEHAWIYGFGYYVVFVCVVIVSYTDEFSRYYPFYKLAARSWFDFLAWELLYAAQFFSLEFFFRGWWLKTLKPSLGSHAIFVMVVPYCMIHYGKPFPETMAAIVAGLFLGTLAMKTRSIWSGFLIHVSVAISMDTAALLQTAGLPDRWWPNL